MKAMTNGQARLVNAELVTFSTSEEIINMLDAVLEKNWLAFPLWADGQIRLRQIA